MKKNDRQRGTYGNGTVYQKNDTTWIAQKVVMFEGYGKRKISGSGSTESKAIKKREANIKKFKLQLEKEKYEAAHQKEIEAKKKEEEAKKKGTLGNYILQWFEGYVKFNCSVTTYDTYMREYNYYIKGHAIADMDITQITKDELLKYYKELFLNGKKRTGEGLNYNTVNKARAHIRGALKRAFKAGLIQRDPHDEIHEFNESSYVKFNPDAMITASNQGTVITQVDKKIHPMTEDEARRFLEASRDTRFFTMFALALTTGCRRGELLGLKWENVHMDQNYIVIDKSLAYITRPNRKVGESVKMPVLKEPKSKSSRRAIPLSKVALCALQMRKLECEREKQLFGEDYMDKGFVFCQENGDYYSEDKVHYWFKKCVKAAGITNHTLHDCRHTVCTFLINRDAQPKLIQTLLGHSMLSTTMDIYGDMFLDVEGKFIRKLDDIYGIEGKKE